jgi:diguanylate cyclase (GGDEF)-like protein
MSNLTRIEVLQEILSILPVGVWIMDHTGKIVYANTAGRKLWGGARYVGPEDFGQFKGWWVATGQRIAPEEWAAVRAIRDGEVSIDEEVEIECFDGSRKVILNSAIPLRDQQKNIVGAVVVHHDITERKRFEERLRGMAEQDPLTNTFNRRSLFQFLEAEIQRARRYGTPLSVIMFDVDHFKEINDNHGHTAGDQVLVGIAGIVYGRLRNVDRLARFGGEEFLIVTPGIDAQGAAILAERLRHQIANAKFDASLPQVTCSFGVCQFRDEETDALIRRVDDLLYQAKEAGRNCVVGE